MELVRPVRVDPTGISGPTKSMVAGRRWRRTSPGLYVPAEVDSTVVEQRILEASCRLPPSGAVTGWAALRLLGVEYCDGRGQSVDLVVPLGIRLGATSGVAVHQERLDQSETSTVHGIPVTTPLRATFDATRRAPDLRAAVTVLDLVMTARLVTRSAMRDLVASKSGWAGVRQVARAVALADDRCLSPMESRLRMIWVLDAGLPSPRCNWPVADQLGQFIGRPDLLSEELAVVGEFDGAEHRSRSRHRDDLRRDDAFRRVGLEPFRVVGADLNDTRLVLRRIDEAIERSRVSPYPRTWLIRRNPRPV